jgi:hypothetical protein
MLGLVVISVSPYNTLETKYWQESQLDYPIYDPLPWIVFSKKNIFFDEYTVSGDVVTVVGYWRLEGMTWKKCEGSLSFRDSNFVPHKVERKRTTVEIISESCK